MDGDPRLGKRLTPDIKSTSTEDGLHAWNDRRVSVNALMDTRWSPVWMKHGSCVRRVAAVLMQWKTAG